MKHDDSQGFISAYNKPNTAPEARTDSLELGLWLSRKHSHAIDHRALPGMLLRNRRNCRHVAFKGPV